MDAEARRRAEEVVTVWWLQEYGHEPWRADDPEVTRWIDLIADAVAKAVKEEREKFMSDLERLVAGLEGYAVEYRQEIDAYKETLRGR